MQVSNLKLSYRVILFKFNHTFEIRICKKININFISDDINLWWDFKESNISFSKKLMINNNYTVIEPIKNTMLS